MKREIKKYFQYLCKVIEELDVEEIEKAMTAIEQAFYRNAVVYVFGNGGSAATASHLVCDFNKGMCENLETRFHVVCLNDNIPVITAIANDYSYDDIYYMQLKNRLKENDLVMALSGTGNSLNIIKAVEYAKSIDCPVIGITGFDGGKLYEMADYHLHVPIKDMQFAEDVHMIFDHMIMRVLGKRLNDGQEVR